MTMTKHTGAPERTLTVIKDAWWEGNRLEAELTTSTGETLPKWLERAISQNAPEGIVTVTMYEDGARIKTSSGFIHDAFKPGRRR